MSRMVNVVSCTLRRDDKYLIGFKDGRDTGHAVSDKPVQVGADVRVRDGKVVA